MEIPGPKRISCGKTKKRRDEVERLAQNVRDSCEVMSNWIKANYDQAKALTYMKEIADLLAHNFSKLAKRVETEASRVEEKEVRDKLLAVRDSLERHCEELQVPLTELGCAKDEILLSLDANLVEVKLVEKHTRNVEKSWSLVDYVIKLLKEIISGIGPVDEQERQKLQRDREKNKEKMAELAAKESDDEEKKDSKKKSKIENEDDEDESDEEDE